MKTPWVRRPKLKVIDNFFSSNGKYVIIRYEEPNVLAFQAINKSSLYDLAHAIYNDCIKSLNISTQLTCYVIFYNQRNMEYEYKLENCQSMEDTLKEISKKFEL